MGEAYAETLDRIYFLKKTHQIVEIWECQYENLLRKNSEMQSFVAQLSIQEKLEPRDAFFGGLTFLLYLNDSQLLIVVVFNDVEAFEYMYKMTTFFLVV